MGSAKKDTWGRSPSVPTQRGMMEVNLRLSASVLRLLAAIASQTSPGLDVIRVGGGDDDTIVDKVGKLLALAIGFCNVQRQAIERLFLVLHAVRAGIFHALQ